MAEGHILPLSLRVRRKREGTPPSKITTLKGNLLPAGPRATVEKPRISGAETS